METDQPDPVPASFFGTYETAQECSDLEVDPEEGLALEYEKLAQDEGLEHLIRTVPLGSELEPLGLTLCFVEKILLLSPTDRTKLVDIDTLVVSADLQVVGKILEVFGPIEAPMYSVLCQPEYLEDGRLPPSQPLYYLPHQASIVQTEALKALKCTDGDGELGQEEFYSDDEEEAMARRQKKQKSKRQIGELEPGELDE